MAKPKKWLLWIGLPVSLALVALLLTTPTEPHHDGRPISEWMADLAQNNYETQQVARAAIQAMGSEALPYLTNAFEKRDTLSLRLYRQKFLSPKIIEWLRPKMQWHQPIAESRAAAAALTSLGPAATNAIPTLVAGLRDPSWAVSESAAKALGAIGPPAIPALRQRMAVADVSELPWALYALGAMNTNGASAAADVSKFLAHHTIGISERAQLTLMQIGPASADVLGDHLASTNTKLCLSALKVLLNCHPKSLSLTNHLIPLTTNENSEIRWSARAVLSALQPPPQIVNPIWLKGLQDPDLPNVRLSLAALSSPPSQVRIYHDEIAALVSHPHPEIAATASNLLKRFPRNSNP